MRSLSAAAAFFALVAAVIKCGIVGIEVLRVKVILCDAQGIAEALEVHDFALAKEFDRFAYIGIVHQAQNIVVGGSGFLLGGEVFHEVGDDIAHALQRRCGEGNACRTLRINTGRMVDKIGVKAGIFNLLGREVPRELVEDRCDHLNMRELLRAQRSIGNVPKYQI